MYPKVTRHLNLLSGSSQPWIRSNSSTGMSRHLYFRNNHNMAFGSIIHYLFDIILSIKTTMRLAIKHIAVEMVNLWRVTESTDLCQFRIFLDFNTPSLIICQMPMKYVHLQFCHSIQQIEDDFFTFEIPTFIQHESTPGKSRIIRHQSFLNCQASFSFFNNLAQSLHTVKHSFGSRSLNCNPASGSFQYISTFFIR